MQEITKAISTKNNGKEKEKRGVINGTSNKEDINGEIKQVKSGGNHYSKKKHHVIDL